MKQYISKSALVAEIEKCYNESLKRAKITDSDYWNAKADAYRNVLAILNDTLEVKEVGVDFGDPQGDIGVKWVQEEPVSNDLEEAAKNHKSAIHIVSPQWTSEVEKAFKAGAEWQKEQMLKEDKS